MADYFVHRSQSTANSARHIIVAGHRGQAPVRSVIGEAATHPPTPTPRDPAVLGMHRYSSFQLVEIAERRGRKKHAEALSMLWRVLA